MKSRAGKELRWPRRALHCLHARSLVRQIIFRLSSKSERKVLVLSLTASSQILLFVFATVATAHSEFRKRCAEHTGMSGHTDEKGSSAHWAEAYYQDQRKTQGWSSLCRPAAVAAYIAIAGRVIAGPLALILLFTSTAYLSDGTVFINADQSIFAFTERDPSMAGGCTGCLGPCKIAMLKYKLIENMAITSAPPFFIFTSLPQLSRCTTSAL